MLDSLGKLSVLLSMLCLSVLGAASAEGGETRNVLFIAIDDLRPALACYGDKTAKTPNIDALAERGVLFERAYCQQAVCSPSRLSLLTGLRPDTIRVWDLGTHFRKARPRAVTLPEYFKNAGYPTQAIGKIFQPPEAPKNACLIFSKPKLNEYKSIFA